MFGKKRCSCGENLNGKWNFCPNCGTNLKERNINEEINREIQRMNKMLGFGRVMGLPKMDIKQGSDGISIIISSDMETGQKARQMRMEKPVENVRKMPENVEEPETRIERNGKNQIITIKLPGVKYEDIEIKRLEQSIEIRAFATDKAYFKVIAVPSNAAISKSFKDEMLKIEIMK
jgi:HSP20 family molecular chaperone IbpA